MEKQRKKSSNKSNGKSRPHVPASTKLQVLAESGYMCANPRCKHILTLEIHHLEWVREGGGNEPSNLIALCSNCHALHTRGHIPRNAIDVWKQMLMLVNASLDRDSLDLLLFMYKFEKKSLDIKREWEDWKHRKNAERKQLEENDDTTQGQLRDHEKKWEAIEPEISHDSPLQVTGDGLLRLVRLIRTGLVDEGVQQWTGFDTDRYFWEPSLTSTGKRLAEAFINGDAKSFRELLMGQHEPHEDNKT